MQNLPQTQEQHMTIKYLNRNIGYNSEGSKILFDGIYC